MKFSIRHIWDPSPLTEKPIRAYQRKEPFIASLTNPVSMEFLRLELLYLEEMTGRPAKAWEDFFGLNRKIKIITSRWATDWHSLVNAIADGPDAIAPKIIIPVIHAANEVFIKIRDQSGDITDYGAALLYFPNTIKQIKFSAHADLKCVGPLNKYEVTSGTLTSSQKLSVFKRTGAPERPQIKRLALFLSETLQRQKISPGRIEPGSNRYHIVFKILTTCLSGHLPKMTEESIRTTCRETRQNHESMRDLEQFKKLLKAFKERTERGKPRQQSGKDPRPP